MTSVGDAYLTDLWIASLAFDDQGLELRDEQIVVLDGSAR
jgi:hypothetical protein